jgi:SOS response regulatory protein OraA/RecX
MVTKSKSMVTKSKVKKGGFGIQFTKIPLYLRNKIKQFKNLTKEDIINLFLTGLSVSAIIAIIVKINRYKTKQDLIKTNNKISKLISKGYSQKEIDTIFREEELENRRRQDARTRMNHEVDLARTIFSK